MENEPIRVLHIVPNMQAGGLETLIMNIYRNIDRTKVQFDFLVHYTGNYFYDDEIRSLGGRIYKLSVRDDNNFIKYLKDLDAFFKKHPEYKIVHGHMESLGQFYFKAAKKDGVPVRVAHSHNSATENTFKGKIKGLLLKRSAVKNKARAEFWSDYGKLSYTELIDKYIPYSKKEAIMDKVKRVMVSTGLSKNLKIKKLLTKIKK